MLGRSFKIAQVSGIPVKLHWSFILIVLLLIYMSVFKDLSFPKLFSFCLLFALLFACVLLHELGHVLAARWLNIEARDIILSPVGGLARIEAMEDFPKKEILVALAGPMVNFILALTLFLYLYFIAAGDWNFEPYSALAYLSFPAILYFLLFINVLLFLFNLLPAFPMDGGRVLRAVLSLKFDSLRATYMASIIGRAFAVMFFIIAFVGRHYALTVISAFIYLMALSEYRILAAKLSRQEDSEERPVRAIKKAGPSFPPTNRPEEDLNT